MIFADVLRSFDIVLIFIFTSTQAISTKQLNGNKLCINHDAVVSQFRYCSEPFIGLQVMSEDNKTEIRCPQDSVILIISIHPFNNQDISPACEISCSARLFQENCQQKNNNSNDSNSSCLLGVSDVLQTVGCSDFKAEIRFVCFKRKSSHGVEEDVKRRGKSLLCSRFLHSVNNFVGFKEQRSIEHRTSFSKSSTTSNRNGSLKISPSTTKRHKSKVESFHRKRDLTYGSTKGLYHISNSTEVPGTNKSSGSIPDDIKSNKSLHGNHTLPRETFLGRQVSLWFSSINEPQLIGIFIKSNLEKFVLYVVVFICCGIMSVMAVVIYSLAYQIKYRRSYSLNSNNNKNNQQKASKITYHSPNNWRTPDSGSSTGDDRTLHDEEANVMDRTDSRHVMCSSLTETRSNRGENPSSQHQPLNNNSVRGSTTLPSPPNSLIFERASPMAPDGSSESPREKPNTPSHADIHFVDRLSS